MHAQSATHWKGSAKRLSVILALCAAFALAWFVDTATAQQYPTKQVRIITPFPPGSGPDGIVRVVGDKLGSIWGRQVTVENRPGGNGFIAFDAAKRARPDGYTLVQMDDAHMSMQPHLFKNIPYDVARDFAPVAAMFRAYFFVVVPSDSKWQNMKDLIDAAKAKNGDLTYGSWFVGSPGHFGAAMLEADTGTKMTHVLYKETSQLYAAVGNNEVNWAFGTAASSGPMYRAKKVKYIAVAAKNRVQGFPDVPTVEEAGGPAGFEVRAWVALFAPSGTPATIIATINEELGKVLQDPEVRQRLATFVFEPYAAAPSEITKEREADLQRYGEIVKKANISIE